LGYFKEVEKLPFTLRHYWLKFEDFPKWKESFKAWYKDGKRGAQDNEHEEGPSKGKDRLRGHKASKTDLRHQALSIALENTLNSLFADKEEACAKRDEQRRRDKEEQMQIFRRCTKEDP
jgi:hypothetical protein